MQALAFPTIRVNSMSETQRRIERKIADASVSLMSNAKWRKLLTEIDGLAFGLQWKFINSE